ncbi:hypothetical protein [Janthinobacterium agaricidamnosum]|uniref:Transmembrane protein n=1 Tax=Janthinobacterium agaricidamnosum NBRC 102515 = DSM 9628 TaxID=1349767 RepID=W0V923_9BURK|nr:hypothetical protein [Janthinobacterium agaricidamnosum]CDG83848.1 hypothetical protein GJA_3228 [Janthinobacterium agaricidamnosum NBRC 102515 = DSM 9628]
MGNSLHNKIYLGRRSPGWNARGLAALVLLSGVASAGLVWLVLRTLK